LFSVYPALSASPLQIRGPLTVKMMPEATIDGHEFDFDTLVLAMAQGTFTRPGRKGLPLLVSVRARNPSRGRV
jgi:hypothetical protein